MITGTPLMNRPCELFNLMKAIRPDVMRNFLEYAYRFCDPQERSYGMDYSGSSNSRELNYILTESFMLRRLKKEVLT
jgi:SWI/SNF-related matrix-associated actin-dependent regulator of chromatin subfamily A-like protein 1